MADDDVLEQNNVVMSDPSRALNAGPKTYNPALGMLLVRNPEAAAEILAQRGAPVPEDASPNISHRDAARGLGAALDPSWGALPGVGQNPNEAAQTNPIMSRPDPEVGQSFPSAPASPSVRSPMVPPMGGWPGAGGTSEGPSDIPSIPLGSYHRSSQDVSGPTPSGDSTNQTGAAVPAPATSEKPGDLSKSEPAMPAGMRMTRGPDSSASVHPDKTVDGLAKALAGLQGMTPKPFLPSTPGAYHPSNPLSRSTLPQQLMAEILGAAKPTSTFRLGEALRGRSYA